MGGGGGRAGEWEEGEQSDIKIITVAYVLFYPTPLANFAATELQDGHEMSGHE